MAFANASPQRSTRSLKPSQSRLIRFLARVGWGREDSRICQLRANIEFSNALADGAVEVCIKCASSPRLTVGDYISLNPYLIIRIMRVDAKSKLLHQRHRLCVVVQGVVNNIH